MSPAEVETALGELASAMARYVRTANQLAEMHAAKIRELELEVQALRFCNEWNDIPK